MNRNIWKYKEHKDFVKDTIENTKGLTKSALAKACQCQSAYISQILNGHANFSIEQAISAGSYLGLLPQEQDFFILLYQENRAGTVEARSYFQNKIEISINENLTLSKHINTKTMLTKDEKTQYFSNWYYTALHLSTTLMDSPNLMEMAKMFDLSIERVTEIMDFLLKTGLVIKENNKYKPGETRLHLDSKSYLTPLVHSNTRHFVIDKIAKLEQKDFADNLIYSSTISLSHKDYLKIKEKLIKTIKEIKTTIKDSKEETLGVFNIDFMRL